MCVIINCVNEFPSLATLESAEQMNPHGAGVAWVENGKVKYKKGIDLDAKKIFEMTKTLPLPAIIHFRIASIGKIIPELCHPFPINENADLTLEGISDSVLFHNGTWSNWKKAIEDSISKKQIPFSLANQEWSDSRSMAWLADKFGVDILKRIPLGNKISVLTPKGIITFGKFVSVGKFSCSNDYFTPATWDLETVNYYPHNKVPVKSKSKLNSKQKKKLKKRYEKSIQQQIDKDESYTISNEDDDYNKAKEELYDDMSIVAKQYFDKNIDNGKFRR